MSWKKPGQNVHPHRPTKTATELWATTSFGSESPNVCLQSKFSNSWPQILILSFVVCTPTGEAAVAPGDGLLPCTSASTNLEIIPCLKPCQRPSCQLRCKVVAPPMVAYRISTRSVSAEVVSGHLTMLPPGKPIISQGAPFCTAFLPGNLLFSLNEKNRYLFIYQRDLRNCFLELIFQMRKNRPRLDYLTKVKWFISYRQSGLGALTHKSVFSLCGRELPVLQSRGRFFAFCFFYMLTENWLGSRTQTNIRRFLWRCEAFYGQSVLPGTMQTGRMAKSKIFHMPALLNIQK